jgi:hypothetical protein
MKINDHDVHDEFSAEQKRPLQCGIRSEYKQYLNKAATLAEWRCGIDLTLGTYIPE